MGGNTETYTFTGSISSQEDSIQHTFDVPSNCIKVEAILNMPSDTDFDLSVWDNQNRRTGGWISTESKNRYDIPNSQYSGYNANPEWVTVDPVATYGTWKTGCFAYSGSGSYTITVTLTLTGTSISIIASEDIFVDARFPTSNFAVNTYYLWTGTQSADASCIARSFFKFSLGSIPSGATINSATFYAYCNCFSATTTEGVYYVSDNSWSRNTMTWNNQPSTAASPTSTATITAANSWYSWTITSNVQTALSAGTLSLAIKAYPEEPGTEHWIDYEPMESTANHEPYIAVDYTTVANTPPTASFTYTPSSPTTDDTIQFSDQSTDSDGYIASWSWNFGDGSTSTSRNPTHQYSSAGTYSVTLTVVDDDGGAASHSKIINVVGITYIFQKWWIDSPHNCPNNYDKTWTITRPGIKIKYIYFSKIDLENYWDYLYIYDKNDNLIYSITGYYPNVGYMIGVDTDTIKLRLVTDESVNSWGFQLKAISWGVSAIESPHPYSNNADNTWTFTEGHSNRMRLYFSKLDVEKDYDYVYLYDGNNNQKWSYTNSGTYPGTPSEWVYSPWIDGDTIKIRLVTDGSVTGYGFYVYRVECEPKTYGYGTFAIKNYRDGSQLPQAFDVVDECDSWLWLDGTTDACWIKKFDKRDHDIWRDDYGYTIDAADFVVSIAHGGGVEECNGFR